MSINLSAPQLTELKPRIVVVGIGGAGGNAVNNMILTGLGGVEFIVANTDAQALSLSQADRKIQLGVSITQGLGCGAQPEVGRSQSQIVPPHAPTSGHQKFSRIQRPTRVKRPPSSLPVASAVPSFSSGRRIA